MNALIIFVAQYLIILVPIVLLQLLWTLPQKERVRFVALSVFSLALAYIFAKIGSHLYDNPRPFMVGAFDPLVPHGIENGFPSMHTLFAATTAALIFTKQKVTGAALYFVAVLIGTARVIAGVHHGIDVVAGLTLAIAAVLLARQLLSIRVYRY